MRLKTKLVLSALGLALAIVLGLSALFLAELLSQRIAQTTEDNEVLGHEVVSMTRQAIEVGLREHPPVDRTDQAFQTAVLDALRAHDPLTDTMKAIVRYSPTVQDVSVTDARGLTLVSTDPDALDQPLVKRTSLSSVRDRSLVGQWREMFGPARVFNIESTLTRNGVPFLVVHVGVRSSFLLATFQPLLLTGLWVALAAALVSMLAAALLSNAVLQPINRISEQLEKLTQPSPEEAPQPQPALREDRDAVVRVTRTIDRLGRQIRTTEAEYTALQANLNQMLDTLRDGVLLFTADRRAAMVSDSVAHFLDRTGEVLAGKLLEEIFDLDTVLGAAALTAFVSDARATSETITLEDGRRVQLSMNRIDSGRAGQGEAGALLTLRDIESVQKLEQELEVSRRLMAIGRLTAGAGHEVKNPINAMVLHLELLRSKLAEGGAADASGDRFRGAQRHVDILAGEMQRLDRVVQTLADFTRPMELHLEDYDLRQVIASVVELTAAEMAENQVRVEVKTTSARTMVRIDTDLIRQATLNIMLNAMQAMPRGGGVCLEVRREGTNAVVEITDEGEGIPAELLPRIFDLYFTTKATGSGIGLAITYRILQMHGGALEVRSSTSAHPDTGPAGTTFTLRLPMILTGPSSGMREVDRASAGESEKRVW